MLLPFGSQSRLDKLLDSLKAHIFMNNLDESLFIQKVKDAVYNDFIDEKQKQQFLLMNDDDNNKQG